MEKYMPYIVPLFIAIISSLATIIINNRNINSNKEQQVAESARILSEASANLAKTYAPQLKELKREFDEAEEKIDILNDRLDTQDDTIGQQTMRIKELEEKIKQLEQEKKEWSKKYDTLYDWAMSLVLELAKRDVRAESPPDELNIEMPEFGKKRIDM